MAPIRRLSAALAAATALAAPAAAQPVFRYDTAFTIGVDIAGLPPLEELVSNDDFTTLVRVSPATRLSVFRLRQDDPLALLANFPFPAGDVDAVVAGARFDLVGQAFDPVGALVATVDFGGNLAGDDLALILFDLDFGEEVKFGYPDLPFRFFVDSPSGVEGIGPFIGSADRLFVELPSESGLYLVRAAVPEPAAWALVVAGVGLMGVALRRRPRPSRQAASS